MIDCLMHVLGVGVTKSKSDFNIKVILLLEVSVFQLIQCVSFFLLSMVE